MTFRKLNKTYEMSVFCNVLSHYVKDGMKKLLEHFRQIHSGQIVVNIDRRYETIDKFTDLGFMVVKQSVPHPWYFKKSSVLYNVSTNRLKKMLDSYDSNLSFLENMKLNGWNRIWDCGYFKLVLS